MSLTLELNRRLAMKKSGTPGENRLRMLRDTYGRTQLDIELDANLGIGYLQRVELGKVRYPERNTLERILTALNAHSLYGTTRYSGTVWLRGRYACSERGRDSVGSRNMPDRTQRGSVSGVPAGLRAPPADVELVRPQTF